LGEQTPGHKPAYYDRGATNEPERNGERRCNHFQPESKRREADKAGSQRCGLEEVESFVPAWGKPPGIVEVAETKDDVPNEEKTSE
jgi:hypothetical protein